MTRHVTCEKARCHVTQRNHNLNFHLISQTSASSRKLPSHLCTYCVLIMPDLGTAEASNGEKATTRSSDLTACSPPSQQSHSITSPHLSKSPVSSRKRSSAMTTSKLAGGLGFLDLPPEIRNMVYRHLKPEQDYYLLHLRVTDLAYKRYRVRWKLSLTSDPWMSIQTDDSRSLFRLAKTCRTIYAEALPVWYQSFAYRIGGQSFPYKIGGPMHGEDYLRALHALPKCVSLHTVKSLTLSLLVDETLAETLDGLFEVFGDKMDSLRIRFKFPKPHWSNPSCWGPDEKELLDIAKGEVLPLWKHIKYQRPILIFHSSNIIRGLSPAAKAFKKIMEGKSRLVKLVVID